MKCIFAIPRTVSLRASPPVLGAVLLASPASSLIGGAASGGQTAASAVRQSGPMDGYVDTLTVRHSSLPERRQRAGSRGEMARLFTAASAMAAKVQAGRPGVCLKVVAARTGPVADAGKRVDEVVTQAKTDADAPQGGGSDASG
jgi:hypothetical protein